MPKFAKLRTSSIALIVANVIPLLGVLFWKWSTFAIVAVYWSENIVIGLINVLKIATCNPNEEEVLESLKSKKKLASHQIDMLRAQLSNGALGHVGIKLFLTPFFAFHYGFFCFVHGIFVFVLFGGDSGFMGGPGPSIAGALERFSQEGLWVGVIAMFISHLISFFTNYLGRGENRQTIAPMLMIQPYKRIVVLHLAILFGGFAVMALGSPVVALLILIVGKTILDLKFHQQEHQESDSDLPDQMVTAE